MVWEKLCEGGKGLILVGVASWQWLKKRWIVLKEKVCSSILHCSSRCSKGSFLSTYIHGSVDVAVLWEPEILGAMLNFTWYLIPKVVQAPRLCCFPAKSVKVGNAWQIMCWNPIKVWYRLPSYLLDRCGLLEWKKKTPKTNQQYIDTIAVCHNMYINL